MNPKPSSSALAAVAWSDAVDTADAFDIPPLATVLPLSPFITEPGRRFVLDEDRFMADIEEMPAFLSAPREEYLRAAEIIPMLAILARHQ
ncbi:hypothetical protein [Bradyrhizobium sp. 150]|uniref:hypothetical protein n=1 Tax=Bradyrhizobium sp. 150 TaxID=2782625 RepID=UPI001FF938E4|nr:hypothetical protein [Bradyrhizobium sp. 150]MCK1671040.1 hypothetical protein [Bradyrhizobium sp. 150]